MEPNTDLPPVTIAVDLTVQQPLLSDLGAPSPTIFEAASPPEDALVWLHLGTAWLKLSIIAELAEFYCDQIGEPLSWLGYGTAIQQAGGSTGALEKATEYYLAAAKADPALAEAQYALGRSAQIAGDREKALGHFRSCSHLKPHPVAPAGMHLKANAHWESACVLEDLGDDQGAMAEFRNALSNLDTFGVHHLRFAKFLRRLGHHAEAAKHYMECTRYTHRYFPEFQPPPLEASTQAPSPTQLDSIFTTRNGENIYFHAGQYILIPAGIKPQDVAVLAQSTESNTSPLLSRRRQLISKVLARLFKPKHRLPPQTKTAGSILDLID